jgi:hypothetical protein
LDCLWALLKGIGKLLVNASRLLDSLWAILKAAGKCPNTYRQPRGEEAELPSGCWQKHGNFRSFPLNCYIFVYINKKSKTHRKILETLSGSSPKYFLSHHATVGQAQTCATVPLNPPI